MTDSTAKKHYLVILGARPNFVKAAPFFKRAEEYPQFTFTIVHTGQHFDENMSKIFFDEMKIPQPHIQLDIKGDFHTEKIGKMFTALKKVADNEAIDGVIVFGDINSALAGAVAAVSVGRKIIHIESGLRSHDRRMPEEINRAIIDHLSHALFVTEESGRSNLRSEGIHEDKIHMVGNIMIESIELFRSHFDASQILRDLDLEGKKYIVTTIHRQENTDHAPTLKKILDMLSSLADRHTLVMPLHPGTRQKIQNFGFNTQLAKIQLIAPVGYIDFMKLIIESDGVVTDSGGIQEETTHLGIPCCTIRDNTERPVTLTHGSNKLFPIEEMDIREIIAHLEQEKSERMSIPFWDNQVSKRIFEVLQKL